MCVFLDKCIQCEQRFERGRLDSCRGVRDLPRGFCMCSRDFEYSVWFIPAAFSLTTCQGQLHIVGGKRLIQWTTPLFDCSCLSNHVCVSLMERLISGILRISTPAERSSAVFHAVDFHHKVGPPICFWRLMVDVSKSCCHSHGTREVFRSKPSVRHVRYSKLYGIQRHMAILFFAAMWQLSCLW